MAKKKDKPKPRPRNAYVAAVSGILLSLIIPAMNLTGSPQQKVFQYFKNLSGNITGFSIDTSDWRAERLVTFWGPVGLGVGGSIAASKIGINRALAQRTQGVPLLNRIRV